MDTAYILTFIGDDRPGLVEELAQVVENNAGNWHESRLSQLAGKFAGLVLVSVPTQQAATLETDLLGLSDAGLTVNLTPAASADRSVITAAGVPGKTVVLSVMGPDRPGIVREISRALARRQVNVTKMDSNVDSAPMSGEMLFSARIDAVVPESVDPDDLIDTLDDIAEHMTLEIDLEL